jgi:predicted DNA-binding WGR domain protein
VLQYLIYPEATMPYFENTLPGHNKFWEITVNEQTCEAVVRWGRIGTRGQSKTHHFTSRVEAAQFGEDIINEKLAKGYEPR